MSDHKQYWLSPVGGFDDFGSPYKGVMYDARTKHGPWACMTEQSWERHRVDERLGTGIGQKYVEQADGTWLKVAG